MASHSKIKIMIKKLIFLNLIILILLSCKKDKVEIPAVIPPMGASETFDFFKVGNKWVYQEFQIYQDGEPTHILTDTAYYIGKDEAEDSVLYMKRHFSTGLEGIQTEKVENGIYYNLRHAHYLPRGFVKPNISYQGIFTTDVDSLLITVLNTDTIYQEFGMNIKCYTIKYFPIRDNYRNNNWVESYFLINNKIGVVSHTQIGHNIVIPNDILLVSKNLMNYSFVK